MYYVKSFILATLIGSLVMGINEILGITINDNIYPVITIIILILSILFKSKIENKPKYNQNDNKDIQELEMERIKLNNKNTIWVGDDSMKKEEILNEIKNDQRPKRGIDRTITIDEMISEMRLNPVRFKREFSDKILKIENVIIENIIDSVLGNNIMLNIKYPNMEVRFVVPRSEDGIDIVSEYNIGEYSSLICKINLVKTNNNYIELIPILPEIDY